MKKILSFLKNFILIIIRIFIPKKNKVQREEYENIQSRISTQEQTEIAEPPKTDQFIDIPKTVIIESLQPEIKDRADINIVPNGNDTHQDNVYQEVLPQEEVKLTDSSPVKPKKVTKKKNKKIPYDYSAQYIDDMLDDDEVKEKIVYIVGMNKNFWLAEFKCPCGCGGIIKLNLLKGGEHLWKVSNKSGKGISISPSIDRRVGCHSHFHITNGRVIWWTTTRNEN